MGRFGEQLGWVLNGGSGGDSNSRAGKKRCLIVTHTWINSHLPVLSQETKPCTYSCPRPYSKKRPPGWHSLLPHPCPGLLRLCLALGPSFWDSLLLLELTQPLGCCTPLPRCRTLGSCTVLPQPLAASSYLELLSMHPCYLLSGSSLPCWVLPTPVFTGFPVSFSRCLCSTPVFSPRPPFLNHTHFLRGEHLIPKRF